MMGALFDLSRPLMFAFPPEDAHEFTIRSLEIGLYPRDTSRGDPCLGQNLWELEFPNPVGIAAGFDKDARAYRAVLGMGCGFAEIGTVTPLPQAGNPTPRIFRLVNERGVINRLGFNNGGHAAALSRLAGRPADGIIGINIGANKDSADRAADYVLGLQTFYDVASYFTVNISSPNTPGLRDLQAPAALDELLGRIMEARAKLVAEGKLKHPVIVKIAPDVAVEDLPAIADRFKAHNVDGIAVSNTTLSRTGSTSPAAKEGGGMSGRPLFHRSTVMLARVYRETGGKIPLIGIGGIDSGETALEKIKAGATLLQLYTGLIYEGPGLIGRIKSHLASAVRDAGVSSIADLVGQSANAWADKPIEV